jgi:hypothetical protein
MAHYNFIDLTGQPFGRWLVLERAANDARSRAQWLCQCACGTVRSVNGTSLRQGISLSCGCLCKERTSRARRKHGMTRTPEYTVWLNIRRRCYEPRNNRFAYYGGRGIIVCPEWRESFEQFYADMGIRPSLKHTVERRDNDGNYTPENCYWATDDIQRRNKRTNRMLTFEGRTLCAKDWSKITGLHRTTILQRVDSGWPVDQALTMPPQGPLKPRS